VHAMVHMSMFVKTVMFIFGCLTITACVMFANIHANVRKKQFSGVLGDIQSPKKKIVVGGQDVKQVNSATGELFSGNVIRRFVGLKKHGGVWSSSSTRISFQTPMCSKWNVVTTIHEATAAVRTAAAVPGWCAVIVGDRKTPGNYMRNWKSTEGDTVVFLSAAMQEREALGRQDSVGAYVRHVPFNHFSRKNIGYLYAIAYGADYIFDFDA